MSALARSPRSAVVVPAVHSPHAVTCLRCLAKRGVHTVAVYERETPAFRSRYCDETHLSPDPSSDLEGYKEALLTLARRDDVEAVVPMREADVYVLSLYRSEFAPHVGPVWPSFETLSTAHDRVRLVRAARRAGVETPKTRLLDEAAEWSTKQVIKARYAFLGDAYVDGPTPSETVEPPSARYVPPETAPDCESIRAEMGHTPIVQEFVPGEEYALWALYDRGKPVATCQKRQLRAFSHAGGTSVSRETTHAPALEAAGRALLDHLDWHGFASVQFKHDARTDEFVLMEINPRVWVSVACPVRAGLEFPYYYWQLATDESVDVPDGYETGVATHRLGGLGLYFLSVLRDEHPYVDAPPLRAALTAMTASIVEQPHFDYLSLEDPVPFFAELSDWLTARLPP